jgi:hypothetical protein
MKTTRAQAADEALVKKIELHNTAQHTTLGCLGSELHDLEAAALRYAAAYLGLIAVQEGYRGEFFGDAQETLASAAFAIASVPEAS